MGGLPVDFASQSATDGAVRASPAFSVVIATYNRRPLAAAAIRSVVEQTYRAHEVIVVCDGCTDGTAQALRQDFPGVVVIEQKNLGPSAARNTGIAAASADWVVFLDDDDLWHREKLQGLAEYIGQHPEAEAIFAAHWYFSDTEDGPAEMIGLRRDFVAGSLDDCHHQVSGRDLLGTHEAERHQIKGHSFGSLLERNRGLTSGAAVRRPTLIRAGCFSPSQAYGEDWAMFLNVARFCEWHVVPARRDFHRLHGVQLTAGGAWDQVYSLAGFIGAWYCGRPLPCRVPGERIADELSQYGPIYRRIVQGFVWREICRGNLKLALMLRRMGVLILPRWRDRLYSLFPPQLTWRWEKYVLRRHG